MFFFQAEDGIRDLVRSRGLGDVYKRQDVARRLGWPDAAVSWQDVQQRATQDPDFKWSHANTKHASGLLAVLAEFYAGAGLTRGLTVEAATDPAPLEYAVSYTHLRAHETVLDIVCRLLLQKNNITPHSTSNTLYSTI